MPFLDVEWLADRYGVGVYHFFRDYAVTVESGFVAPPTATFHAPLTVFLNGLGTINHILNEEGMKRRRRKRRRKRKKKKKKKKERTRTTTRTRKCCFYGGKKERKTKIGKQPETR